MERRSSASWHIGVSRQLARRPRGPADPRPQHSEPKDSAPYGTRPENLTGLTKKLRDNGALRYRLEAGSLDTLGP